MSSRNGHNPSKKRTHHPPTTWLCPSVQMGVRFELNTFSFQPSPSLFASHLAPFISPLRSAVSRLQGRSGQPLNPIRPLLTQTHNVFLQFHRVRLNFEYESGFGKTEGISRRSMGRGKPSANNAKRSPEPASSNSDVGNQLQSRSGPISPKISPSPSSRSTSNGYTNGTSASSQREEGDEAASHPKPLYLCSPFVEAALVKGNFKTIVMLPKYVDIMEWVAVNSECFLPLDAPTL